MILDAKAMLGEGPIWDVKTQCLFWTDISSCKIHRYNPKKEVSTTIHCPETVGSISIHIDGNLVVAMKTGFYYLDFENQKFTLIRELEEKRSTIRFNDGKCDCKGRFWAGTMAMDQSNEEAIRAGSLYRMDKCGGLKEVIKGVTISNGIAWNLNNDRMYYIDTYIKQVSSYEFDVATGEISNHKTAIVIPEEEGLPDGMTIDMEGMLWIAHWGGSKVTRWDPLKGIKLDEVCVATPNVTCCTFGGKNLDELYITTASSGTKEIGDGGLYRVKLYTRGLETFYFKG